MTSLPPFVKMLTPTSIVVGAPTKSIAAAAVLTRPVIRFAEPTKSATNRVFGRL